MSDQAFLECSSDLGLERRIAALIAECDTVIADSLATGDQRWLWRVEDQRRRLMAPDLRMIVALTTFMPEETPALAAKIAPPLRALADHRPGLGAFLTRLDQVLTAPAP